MCTLEAVQPPAEAWKLVLRSLAQPDLEALQDPPSALRVTANNVCSRNAALRLVSPPGK